MERVAEVPQDMQEVTYSIEGEEALQGIPMDRVSVIDYYKAFVDASVLPREEIYSLFEQRNKGIQAGEEFVEKKMEGQIEVGDEEYLRHQKKIDKGNEAEGEIIKHNLRLVVDIAAKQARRYPHYEQGGVLTFADLVQEGIIGLKRAVEKFDINRGFSFANYATPWIKKTISNSIMEHSHSIGIPKARIKDLARIKRVQDRYLQEQKRAPTVEELEEETGIKKENIMEATELQKELKSIDEKVKNEGKSRTFGESIESKEDIEGDFEHRLEVSDLMLCLTLLEERERKVLILRFAKDMTLKEVGEEIGGLSGEWVRQIENKAIEKLREILLKPGHIPHTSS